MTNTIVDYTYKGRFQLNPDKSVVITFGEAIQMNNLRKHTRTWSINGVAIKEKTSWDHVGITLSGNFSKGHRQLLRRERR